MNNWVFVFSAILVALLLIGINFESLHNYFVWVIPLSKMSPSISYNDYHTGELIGHRFVSMQVDRYIDEESIEVTFSNKGFDGFGMPINSENFEFKKILKEGDGFIAFCYYNDKVKAYHPQFLHLVNVTEDTVWFDHYSAELPDGSLCKHPEIIEHSFDVKWIFPGTADFNVTSGIGLHHSKQYKK